MKTAVVLTNLGGPESQQEIGTFLYNLYNDSDLIKLPFGKKGQSFFARVISRIKSSKSASLYSQIGGGSPIRYNTIKQAHALEAALQKEGEFCVFTAQYIASLCVNILIMIKWNEITRCQVKAALHSRDRCKSYGVSRQQWGKTRAFSF